MSENSNSGGTSFFALLAILFIGLKLAGIIDWEWWVVLSPIWGAFAITLLLVIVVVLFSRGE